MQESRQALSRPNTGSGASRGKESRLGCRKSGRVRPWMRQQVRESSAFRDGPPHIEQSLPQHVRAEKIAIFRREFVRVELLQVTRLSDDEKFIHQRGVGTREEG